MKLTSELAAPAFAAQTRRVVTSLAILATGLVVGGFTLGLAPAAVLPAAGAATCTSTGGVSVVVDYREIGGSTVTACATDGGGKSAAAIFASVGVSISYATRQPGFVCRVNGLPTSDPCVNASPSNAYWGLWWADGSSSTWTFSSYSVGGLTVPAGGSVGWSWQQDRAPGESVPPGVAPPVTRSSTPTTTPSPSSSPTASPTSSSPTATPSNGGSSSPTPTSPSPTDPSESPLASESPGDSRASGGPSDEPSLDDESPGDSTSSEGSNPSASASESPGDSSASSASEAGSPTADEPARVPAAVTWGIVGLLVIAIAVSAVVARRRRGV